jgi:hypothetical protein
VDAEDFLPVSFRRAYKKGDPEKGRRYLFVLESFTVGGDGLEPPTSCL